MLRKISITFLSFALLSIAPATSAKKDQPKPGRGGHKHNELMSDADPDCYMCCCGKYKHCDYQCKRIQKSREPVNAGAEATAENKNKKSKNKQSNAVADHLKTDLALMCQKLCFQKKLLEEHGLKVTDPEEEQENKRLKK